MDPESKPHPVRSTAQRQTVTPAQPGHVTKQAIAYLRGILKREPGPKSFAQERAEHKAEENALEEAKYQRGFGSSR